MTAKRKWKPNVDTNRCVDWGDGWTYYAQSKTNTAPNALDALRELVADHIPRLDLKECFCGWNANIQEGPQWPQTWIQWRDHLADSLTQHVCALEAAAYERAADECDGAQFHHWHSTIFKSEEECLRFNRLVCVLGDKIRALASPSQSKEGSHDR